MDGGVEDVQGHPGHVDEAVWDDTDASRVWLGGRRRPGTRVDGTTRPELEAMVARARDGPVLARQGWGGGGGSVPGAGVERGGRADGKVVRRRGRR